MMRALFQAPAMIVTLLAVAIAPGQARAQDAVSPSEQTLPMLDAYRIGPEDTLQIVVWKNEAMSRTVPVRPDGMISLPLLNDVQAAGLTPMELRDLLVKGLAEYMPSPEVSVIVQEVRSSKISILGEVAHPGRFDLKGRTTVLDLLALA